MPVKPIYEDGVFKPMEKVELHFRPHLPEDEDIDDPMSFIGLIQNVPKGVPIAQDHDKYLP